MTNVPTWISRVSAIALATASVTAFATPGGSPEFVMHKASVSLKVSELDDGKIKTFTVKTNDVINEILDQPSGTKIEKNEKLGLITECEDDDNDAVALVVYDDDTNAVISSPTRAIIFDIEAEVTEYDKDGAPKKTDLLVESEDDGGFEFIVGSASESHGKIGKKVADDNTWNQDAVCIKNFKTKSVNGRGFFREEVVMSGKISGGKAQFASDGNIFPGVILGVAKAVNNIDNGETFVTAIGDTVSYDIDVTNAGSQQVTGLSVADALADPVTCGTSTLNPGESTSCTASMTVSAQQFADACGAGIGQGPANIENIAVATVNETVSSFGTNAFVDVDCDDDGGNGAIAIAKDSDVNFADVGDIITYTIDLENLTGGALTGVTVADTRADTLDCEGNGDGTVGDLADTATATCTAETTVTQADVDAACAFGGSLRNIATVTSNETNSFAADDLVGVDCD